MCYYICTSTNYFHYICIMKIYLVKDLNKSTMEVYSNLKKISDSFPLSYWGMQSAIKSKGEYWFKNYHVIKFEVK